MENIVKRVVKYVKRNKFYILTYIFFLIICLLTPISGDDYGNYVKGKEGILGIIRHTKSFYLSWEGRIASRIVILLFTPNKILWNIITPFLFVLIFKSLLENNSFKNRCSYLLLIISIILVNTPMYAQTYTWLAGNITYFYSSALVIYFFTNLYKSIENKLNISKIVLLSALSIIIPMFVENIGFAFVFGNILFIIYLYYLKRKVKINYLFLILSIVSLVFMLISPGSANRINSEGNFYLLSFFEKIYVNMLYHFIPYTITRHTMMLILVLICCDIYIIRKTKFAKTKKVILCILFNMIPLCIVFQNLMNVNIFTYQIYLYIYWLIFFAVFLLSLISTFKDNNKLMLFYILLILTSLSSILSMLVAYSWGDRISILFVIVLSFISLKIIDKNIDFNYLTNYLIKLFFVIITVLVVFFMFCTYKIDKYRIKYIQEQVKDNKKSIEVIYHPLPNIWLSNLKGEYFVDTYKQYQNIDSEVELVLKRLSTREYINIIFGKE